MMVGEHFFMRIYFIVGRRQGAFSERYISGGSGSLLCSGSTQSQRANANSRRHERFSDFNKVSQHITGRLENENIFTRGPDLK